MGGRIAATKRRSREKRGLKESEGSNTFVTLEPKVVCSMAGTSASETIFLAVSRSITLMGKFRDFFCMFVPLQTFNLVQVQFALGPIC